LRRSVDARAVRKAVRVSALRTARGAPVLERSVMEPFGAVCAERGFGESTIGTIGREEDVDDFDSEGDKERERDLVDITLPIED